MGKILASLILLALATTGHADPSGAPPTTVSLNGLWAVSLGADMSYTKSDDVRAYYPGLDLNMPERQIFTGMNLSVRKHLYDTVFLGFGVSSLPRAYSVKISPSADTEDYDLSAVYPFFNGGYVWYRGVNLYSYATAEAGVAFLNQASFNRGGGNPQKGGFEGSCFATGVGLGGVWLMIPSVGLNLEGGYRRAYFDSISDNRPGQPKATFNDSGPYARLGLCFFWGLANPWGDSAPLPAAPGAPPQ